MLVAERREKIKELVKRQRIVKVNEMASLFQVTEETIRRDLENLEKEGYLKRSHGGAIFVDKDKKEQPFLERKVTNVKEKQYIANIAVGHIEENDTIILDASSTAWYMSKILPDIPMKVLTNSLKVTTELADKVNIEVILIGGTLLKESLSFIGHNALEMLEKYNATKAFISFKGVDLESGLTESNEQQALLKRKMLNISQKRYILVDQSKFNKKAFIKVEDFKAADAIISDGPLLECYGDYINTHQLPIELLWK